VDLNAIRATSGASREDSERLPSERGRPAAAIVKVRIVSPNFLLITIFRRDHDASLRPPCRPDGPPVRAICEEKLGMDCEDTKLAAARAADRVVLPP